MNLYYASILVFVASIANAQNNLKQLTLNEINDLIQNHYTILGKTEDEIHAMGRPPSINGLPIWKIDTVTVENNSTAAFDVKKYILINTGLGVIFISISSKSNLAFVMMYIPKETVKKSAVDNYLVKTYNLNPQSKSWSIRKKGSETKIAFTTAKVEYEIFKKFGIFQITIMTFDDKGLRFYDVNKN